MCILYNITIIQRKFCQEKGIEASSTNTHKKFREWLVVTYRGGEPIDKLATHHGYRMIYRVE